MTLKKKTSKTKVLRKSNLMCAEMSTSHIKTNKSDLMSFDKDKLLDDIKANEVKTKARTSNYKKKAIAFDLTRDNDTQQLIDFISLIDASAYDLEDHNIKRTITRDEFRDLLHAYVTRIHDTEKYMILERESYDKLLANQKKTRKKRTTKKTS